MLTKEIIKQVLKDAGHDVVVNNIMPETFNVKVVTPWSAPESRQTIGELGKG